MKPVAEPRATGFGSGTKTSEVRWRRNGCGEGSARRHLNLSSRAVFFADKTVWHCCNPDLSTPCFAGKLKDRITPQVNFFQ